MEGNIYQLDDTVYVNITFLVNFPTIKVALMTVFISFISSQVFLIVFIIPEKFEY